MHCNLYLDGTTRDFCCDEAQLEILRDQMTLPQQLLGRCPSCYSNFINLWCQFTCSPHQSDFVRVVETRVDANSIRNKAYVTKVSA